MTRSGRRTAPGATILAVLGPVLLALALATLHATPSEGRNETPCWVLPNLRVLPVPGSSDCPLRPHDAIRHVQSESRSLTIGNLARLQRAIADADGSLELVVSNAGAQRTVSMPTLVVDRNTRIMRLLAAMSAAALLLALPLFLLWRTDAAAAAPLGAFYSAFATVLVGLIAGRDSTPLTLLAILALASIPATLFHLGLRFPRNRRIAVDQPVIARLPYLASVFLVGLTWIAIYRDPLTWPALALVLVALSGLGWAVLMASCWFAMRESDSPLERARGRLVFYGSGLLPLLPTAALAAVEVPAGHELGILYLWCAAATMPLPIGLAISRYNLFDLGLDIRQGVSRVVYTVLASLGVAAVLWASSRAFGWLRPTPELAPLLGVSLLCVVILEPMRRRILGLLESTLLPRIQELRRIRLRFEAELAKCADEESITERLGSALVDGVAPRSGSIFLRRDELLTLAHAFGRAPPTRSQLAAEAMALLSDPLVHLAALPDAEGAAPGLHAAGVEAVTRLESGGECLGIVLLCSEPHGQPYGGVELDFVTTVCGQAATAIHRSRVQLENLAHERTAAAARIALALAHDTGKDVAWLRRLARRLPRLWADEERWKRDAVAIAELSDELAEVYERVMGEAASLREGQPATELRLDELVSQVVRRIQGIHGKGRVIEVVDPALRNRRLPEFLGRAIGNVLDNAVRASPDGIPARLHVARWDSGLRITIEDEGSGIPESLRPQVFEAGVSTRPSGEGSGVGLTVAAEIIDMLGGSISLEPRREGVGTRAIIRLPSADPEGSE
jgi:signal transduction histidine kinase